MTLKKSDKLIAIIGVIILVVAGIGIVIYAGYDTEEGVPEIEEENPIKTFEVNYLEVSLPIDPDNTDYSIKPKLIGKGTYQGSIVLKEQNLKSLDIMIDYHDNFCGFLFNRIARGIGADTLTIKVYRDDEEVAMKSIRGDGKDVEVPSIEIGTIIPVLTIDAEDIDEAMDLLIEQYIDYDITYEIVITLQTGLWNKFREILSRDTFDMRVNYTQFVYDIINTDNPDDDNPPMDGFEDGTQTWAPMAYPGKN